MVAGQAPLLVCAEYCRSLVVAVCLVGAVVWPVQLTDFVFVRTAQNRQAQVGRGSGFERSQCTGGYQYNN